jgi:hypothetical protein
MHGGGISLGGILAILGIVLIFVWSFWWGLIIGLVGLLFFGGFARGKWYSAFGGAAPADCASRLAAVRVVFTAYLLLITVCLAFYITIGITNHH